MGRVTTTYSHAAPYIRRRLIDSVEGAISSTTQRDKRASWAAVNAYSMALEIMAESEDQRAVEGIPDLDTAPIQALTETLRFFGASTLEAAAGARAAHVRKILSAEGLDGIISRVERYNALQNRARS